MTYQTKFQFQTFKNVYEAKIKEKNVDCMKCIKEVVPFQINCQFTLVDWYNSFVAIKLNSIIQYKKKEKTD